MIEIADYRYLENGFHVLIIIRIATDPRPGYDARRTTRSTLFGRSDAINSITKTHIIVYSLVVVLIV